ncbi:MAG TPA: type II toxin-antitoxin system RatA family toxin [Burkholderiales bacterium]|nr:type II toxin-antitoxin system RatA family toxin [Burkholderiales bacterium]
MKKISRSALVEHSARRLYEIVEDIEAYPRFLPWCLEARARREGGATQATLTVGIGGLRQSFTTRNANRPGESISMALVEGPFRHFSAAWRFQPLSDAACKVEFSMEYDFSSRALARLLEPLFEHIADTMVDAFTRRADSLDAH